MYYALFLILLILGLLMLSSLFSGIETSLTSLNSAHIQKLGPKIGHGLCSDTIKRKERIIATIVLANTVVNIFSSSLATALFVEYFGNSALILFTTGISAIVLLFSEILPKTIALYHPEKVLAAGYSKISFLIKILQPITDCFQWIINIILRLLRINKTRENISATDSIRKLIALHRGNNNINDQEVDILNRVLDLTEVEVSQIMIHRGRIATIGLHFSIEKILETVKGCPYSNIPVWKDRDDNIVHVLNAKSLFNDHKDGVVISSIEHYLKKPWFIPENTLLSVQLSNFRRKNRTFALVVDEYGIFQGIVTIADIVKEIMGDVNEDPQVLAQDIIQISPRKFSINAEMPVRDINRRLKWQLPVEEASTLAGVLINHARKIPAEGEIFTLGETQLQVEKKTYKTIKRILVELKPDPLRDDLDPRDKK